MALRRTKRRRSLSKDGLNLFNLCLSNDGDEIYRRTTKPIKKIVYVLSFTTFLQVISITN